MTIPILLNGEEQLLKHAMALAEALSELGYRGKHFAVAIDGRFVSRSRYEAILLNGGESIEVLSPMQGG